MRIIFATTHNHLPQGVGGSESSTHELCAALVELNQTPAVMAKVHSGDWLGKWNRIKSKIMHLGSFPVDHAMGYPVYRGLKPMDGVSEVVTRFKPDIAVIQAGIPIPMACAFLKAGVPTVVYVHDVEFQEMGEDPRQLIGAGYLANSEFTARKFKEVFGLHASVMYYAFDREKYYVDKPSGKVVFINPHPRKGVEIAFTLAESYPDIPFLFVETWPLTKTELVCLQSRAQRAGNIEWRQATQNPRNIYREASILLAPSQWEEAWGRIATEAQISGIPVLASNRGGLPESVGPGGVLLPHDDIEAWKRTLREVWDEPTIRQELSKKALHYASRSEIQPKVAAKRFLDYVEDFVRSYDFIAPSNINSTQI